MEERPGQYRLSHRGGPPLLQRPLPVGPRKARCSFYRHLRGGLLQGPPNYFSPEELSQGSSYDLTRAHAQIPSEIPRMDSLPSDPLGRTNRPSYPESGRLHHRESASSGARLPVLPGPASAGKNLLSGALRGSLCPGSADEGLFLQERGVHPQERIRPAAFGHCFFSNPSAPARSCQSAGKRVLPMKGIPNPCSMNRPSINSIP